MSVSLTKGSKVSLTKGGSGLSKVFLGLGWDSAKDSKGGFFSSIFGGGNSGGDVDLDASCVVMDAAKHVIDTVWFRQLASKDGSIKHSGDNRTGAGDGDDEVISVDLASVPANAKYLVFTINSFTGQDFSSIENATCRVVNSVNGQELATYVLADKGSHTAAIMGVLIREGSDWEFKAIGQPANGQTFRDLVPAITNSL